VFDDPNVRRPSYGFIDYERLVRHADAHDYHAVMATVPLDCIGAHPRTTSLFRTRADRLSLAFHGNDHVRNELGVPLDRRSALSLCAQALRRVGRFEARTGLAVDRVMTPPHGLCSQSVTSALASLGFDALCAIHPEPWSEQPSADRLLAGWEPATFAGPLSVIPRFPLYCSRTEIALRAFMDNPVVLYGHHDDLSGGLDLLQQAADRVNGLGEVRWMSLGEIARSNADLRLENDRAVVRPYAARIEVVLGEEAKELVVEQPRSATGMRGWSFGDGQIRPFGSAAPRPQDRRVLIRLRPDDEVDPAAVPLPGWRPRAAARRFATETRDRIMPLRTVRHA
jgi:hypothetical protein